MQTLTAGSDKTVNQTAAGATLGQHFQEKDAWRPEQMNLYRAEKSIPSSRSPKSVEEHRR
jgi:hypothetical protein